MTRILLTVGPQGAGKSEFCKSIMALDCDGVTYASRDAFLVDRYGQDAWSPYLGFLERGTQRFYRYVSQLVGFYDVILLECFCPEPLYFEDLKFSLASYSTTAPGI